MTSNVRFSRIPTFRPNAPLRGRLVPRALYAQIDFQGSPRPVCTQWSAFPDRTSYLPRLVSPRPLVQAVPMPSPRAAGTKNARRRAVRLENSPVLRVVFCARIHARPKCAQFMQKTGVSNAYHAQNDHPPLENDDLINNHHFRPQDGHFSSSRSLSTSYNPPHFGFIVPPY